MMATRRDTMGIDGNGLVRVGHFMERLVALPARAWGDVAMECPATVAAASEQAMTAALLDPVLALDAWNVRDDVESAMYRFDCSEGRVYVAKKESRAHVRYVTERAALALLVRNALGPHFAVCYAVFERVIPAGGL
jgi:hypothetical protein